MKKTLESLNIEYPDRSKLMISSDDGYHLKLTLSDDQGQEIGEAILPRQSIRGVAKWLRDWADENEVP